MKIRYVPIATAAAMAVAGLAQADQPGADWMPADQVIQKLTAKGYTHLGKVEADDGHWELEADLKGVRYDLHVDPKSGEITKSERDDD
ncbi:MAG: peptidase [Nitrobacter sp. 62-13]|uniref:PepSY domain-containing protein n=1 Tax=Nitrobacter sp. 62-13 TaxID=1895797 RepID=UPI00095A6E98|nr:PepSY domain-containing protein [Nitrobacter sp. 62-13]OJU28124.1 MAG: peptidase [Nitrobacter sp. 62-13]